MCYISRYFWHHFVSPFHQTLAKVIFLLTMLVPGPASKHFVTTADRFLLKNVTHALNIFKKETAAERWHPHAVLLFSFR